jgi:hypothetical protein
VKIGSLADYLGQSVTVAGLVTDTAPGTATIDDGTGEVRIGCPADVDSLAMLEPGDAIEVTGIVGQDDLGLIIEADPASMIDLPGDGLDPRASQGAGGGLVVAASQPTPAASLAAAMAMRRSSPAALLPDGVAILAVLIVLLAAVALALAVLAAVAVVVAPASTTASTLARHCGPLRRLRELSSRLPSATPTRFTLSWIRRGSDEGRADGRENGCGNGREGERQDGRQEGP